MKFSEEKINLNYLTFINYLKKYDCYSEQMLSEIGEKIKRASYSLEEQYGGAYDGSLIDITLNVLCKIGFKINENVFGRDLNQNNTISDRTMYVNPHNLMRVLLLLNIAKADMFIEQQEEWAKRRGKLYQFNDNLSTLMKLGARTLFICQKYGIILNEEEFSAITSIDREDETNIRFQTPLYAIVNAAKNLTLIKLRREYLIQKKNEIIEL